LLVDDDPSIRNLLARYLEKEGFKTSQAEDGIDALVKLRDTLPKVIVTDLQMPRMSGWELIYVARRRFPTIPIVVLSGSIPREIPAEVKPDRWFEKSINGLPDLVQAIGGLAQERPR
jgi:CheY-like chemotaxis protein